MTRITLHTATTVLTAGAFATLAFDAFGQGLSPLLGFAKLAPVGLAGATLNSVFGANPPGAAHILHLLTGLVAYAFGWFVLARPLQLAIAPRLPWAITAVIYGIILWVFALYVVAHLVTGNTPFLGWTGITWVALWGHILYALVAAWIMEAQGAVLDLRRTPLAVPPE